MSQIDVTAEIDRFAYMVDHIQHKIPIDGAIMLRFFVHPTNVYDTESTMATLLQLPDANRDTMPTTYLSYQW
jgi:hypothetical protein